LPFRETGLEDDILALDIAEPCKIAFKRFEYRARSPIGEHANTKNLGFLLRQRKMQTRHGCRDDRGREHAQ
jgi:hypothetical protein